MHASLSKLQQLTYLRISPIDSVDEAFASISVLPALEKLFLDLASPLHDVERIPLAPATLASSNLRSLTISGRRLGKVPVMFAEDDISVEVRSQTLILLVVENRCQIMWPLLPFEQDIVTCDSANTPLIIF